MYASDGNLQTADGSCAAIYRLLIVVCSELYGSTTNEYRDEASFHRPMSKQDRRSEPMSGHAQAAEPSQPPYITKLQRSASRTLYQALPKSTSPPRTLIT
ncbi:hypothetical protein FHG87_023006 [Trinorchestia longiramus]|nr:hypothetical protein FHG87_023006 [Trinorchestia longiramus]